MNAEVKKWLAIGSSILFVVLGVVFKSDVKSVVCGEAAPVAESVQ